MSYIGNAMQRETSSHDNVYFPPGFGGNACIFHLSKNLEG
jgi:hypothetical protein